MRLRSFRRKVTVAKWIAMIATALFLFGAQALAAPGPKKPTVWKELFVVEQQSPVTAVAASPEMIAVADESCRLRLWDARSGKELELPVRGARFTQPGGSLRFTSNDTYLVMAGRAGGIIRYERRAGGMVGDAMDGLLVLAFTPDLGTLIARDPARTDRLTVHANLWAAGQKNLIRPTAAIEDPDGRAITHIALSGDDRRLALAGPGNMIRVLEHPTLRESHTITLKKDQVPTALAMSLDGDRMAVVGEASLAKVFDRRGAALCDFSELSGVVRAMAMSPDGRRIATASGKMVRVFDSGNGILLGEMDGHRDVVTALAFSTDGKRLVTGSADKTVRIWTPDE